MSCGFDFPYLPFRRPPNAMPGSYNGRALDESISDDTGIMGIDVAHKTTKEDAHASPSRTGFETAP